MKECSNVKLNCLTIYFLFFYKYDLLYVTKHPIKGTIVLIRLHGCRLSVKYSARHGRVMQSQ